MTPSPGRKQRPDRNATAFRLLWSGRFATATFLSMGILVAGCQSSDEKSAALHTDQESSGYPKLQSVPPRPEPTLDTAARQRVVEGLVADRAYARYTSTAVRYRSGVSSLPPPDTAPPRPDRALAEAIAGTDEAKRVPTDEPPASSYEAFDEDVNDGSLDDFVRDLVRETETAPAGDPPGPGATLGPEPAAGPPTASVATRFPARAPLAGGNRLLAGFGIRPRPATAPVPAVAVAQVDGNTPTAGGGPLLEAASRANGAAIRYAQAEAPPPAAPREQLEVRPVGSRRIRGDIALIPFRPGETEVPGYARALLRHAALANAERSTLVVLARGGDIRVAEARAQAVGASLLEAGLAREQLRLYADGDSGREEVMIDQVWR